MSKTAARCLDILTSLIQADGPLSLTDITKTTNLDKSTVARFLRLLVMRGFLTRSSDTRRYMAGPHLISMAWKTLRKMNLSDAVEPHIRCLRDETNETVSLHVPVGSERICISGAESNHPVRRALVIGETLPLFSGVTGKVMLANFPIDQRDTILAAVVDNRERIVLVERTREIRDLGYFCDIGDRIPEVGVLAAPIFDRSGIRAALAIAGPANRWNLDRMISFAPRLKAVTTSISRALGYEPT